MKNNFPTLKEILGGLVEEYEFVNYRNGIIDAYNLIKSKYNENKESNKIERKLRGVRND